MPGTGGDLAALKAAIVAQHGSVYRFCKASGLSKGLVSQLLRGVYGGNAERQLQRVREALAGSGLASRVLRALETAACARCRRANTPRCTRENCSKFFAAQAEAVVQEINRTGPAKYRQVFFKKIFLSGVLASAPRNRGAARGRP